MRIFITGDIHGNIDISKLNIENFPEQKNLTKLDYVIIAGDFGLIWNNSKEEKYWRNWLSQKPFTTLFIDGNHENFELLESYPIEYWNGGKIHKINNSILHLTRGQIFTINNKRIFTFGGASSIDKVNRRKGISWWSRELPSYIEYQEAMDNLDSNNWNVDYIITHTCSLTSLNIIADKLSFDKKKEQINEFFDILQENCFYKYWFFGHYHIDMKISDKQIVLFDKIIEL